MAFQLFLTRWNFPKTMANGRIEIDMWFKLFLIIIMLLAGSCSEAPFDPYFSSRGEPTPILLSNSGNLIIPETATVLEIDSYLVISVGGYYDLVNRYGFDPGYDQLSRTFIYQYTDHNYPESYVVIKQTISPVPGVIEFNHEGIIESSLFWHGTPYDTMGSARNFSYFDMPNGEYDLYFKYNDLTDHYILELNDSLITLIPIDTNYTRPGNREYWREER